MSSAANLDEYISFIGRNINSKKSADGYSKDEKLALMQRKYEYAQLLTAIGRQQEAVEFFREAFLGFHEVKNSDIWLSYYCSIGAQYAAGK